MNLTKIPKKVHYCWFGESQPSEIMQKCIKSWKKFLPEYEIVEWNNENFSPKNNITEKSYTVHHYANSWREDWSVRTWIDTKNLHFTYLNKKRKAH